MTPAQLTGQVDTHVIPLEELQARLHRDATESFRRLRAAAMAEGFELTPVSSFRPFERQLAIWNEKFDGRRPLLDADGRPLVAGSLDEAQRVAAILVWSALPGASRHHWGTDVDVIDTAHVQPGYRVQLVAEEYTADGPFAAAAAWLEANALRYGFFRPYRGTLSGVQAEPWHFSFAPVAEAARRRLSTAVLRAALADVELAGKAVVLSRLEELHHRYVAAIDWP